MKISLLEFANNPYIRLSFLPGFMALNPDERRDHLMSSKGCVETLLLKIKEFQSRLDSLRQSREINSEASRVLEEALSSTFVVANSLKTNLSPFWTQTQPEKEPQVPEASQATEGSEGQVKSNGEAPESCTRCGRPVKPEFKLCPYCGFDLVPKECPGCGQEILAEFRFCPHCGRRSERAILPSLKDIRT